MVDYKGEGAEASASGEKTLSDLRTMAEYNGWADTTTAGLAALDDFINDTLAKVCMLARWPEYIRCDGSFDLATDDDDYALSHTDGDICRLGIVQRSDRSAPLTEYPGGMEEWLHNKRYHAGTGPPTCYALRKYLSSGTTTIEILVYPKPTSGENGDTVYFTCQLLPALLENSTDVTDWPTSRLWLLSEALRARLAQVDRDPAGVALYSADFQRMVNKAFADARPSFMPVIADKQIHSVRDGKILSNCHVEITS